MVGIGFLGAGTLPLHYRYPLNNILRILAQNASDALMETIPSTTTVRDARRIDHGAWNNHSRLNHCWFALSLSLLSISVLSFQRSEISILSLRTPRLASLWILSLSLFCSALSE